MVLNVNCRSIVNKAEKLEGMLLAHDPDIVLLTETWLRDDVFDSEFVPKNYRVFRKDRNGRGGGVAILFRNNTRVVKMPDVQDIESIFCKVYIGNIKYLLGVVYRPPNASLDVIAKLKDYLHCHVKTEDKLIIAGDFNMPNMNWETFISDPCQAADTQISDIMFQYDLTQIVTDPTRIDQGTKSILDIYLVSGNIKESMLCSVTNGISDHKAVVLKLKGVELSQQRMVKKFPNFSKADDESIIDVLAFEYDHFNASNRSVEDLWLCFKRMIEDCVQRFIPLITKKVENHNPWITRETLQLKRKLKRLKKRSNKANSPNLKTTICNIREEIKEKSFRDKEKYFNEKLPSFIKTCPRKFWKEVTPGTCSTDVFLLDGKLESDEKAVCTAFNNYFNSVYTKDNNHLPPFDANLPPISDVTISEEGIFNLLLNLDVKKSVGPDEIPNAFLKRYAEWCAKYLCVLYTRSLNEGVLPEDWKIARIKPLHKAGDKTQIKNYRPVSLTSTACKILEHIIHKQIVTFLDEHKVLTKAQHGFRRGYSTTTQLVETIHDFATALNEGEQLDAIFMDFQKAFDKVSHKKLLHKLQYILKNPKLIVWIRAYLENRQQFVSFNDSCSSKLPVDSGVPQGSVLGPLFFLLYINDIMNDLSVSVKLYADDCVLYTKVSTAGDQIRLNNQFNKVVSWCQEWQMSINYNKTVYMKITLKKNPLCYQYGTNSVNLTEVAEYKYLGVWITNDLNWNKHVDITTGKCLRKLFFLKRSLKYSTPSVRMLAYKTLIRPMLEYAVIIWDPFTKRNINQLEKVQNKGLRFIYNSYGRTSVSELLVKSGLQPVVDRNRTCRLKFFYQLINGHLNVDNAGILRYSSGYATRKRHSKTITPLPSRINCHKYSFFPRTINDWNSLTNDVVLQKKLSLFENSIA